MILECFPIANKPYPGTRRLEALLDFLETQQYCHFMWFFLLFLLDSPDWPLPFYISGPLGSVWSSPLETNTFPSTMTSYAKLCQTSLKPLCVLWCAMQWTLQCMMLYCPLHPCPHTCRFFVCLFVYFSFQIVSIIDWQWADAKSACTHCIRRGLGRRLRSSLLNPSPRCDPPVRYFI